MPIVSDLAGSHPEVDIDVRGHEPAEALALLAVDAVDLALTYDYNLAPDSAGSYESLPLWSAPWSLGAPTREAQRVHGDSPAVFRAFRQRDWIGNSRNRADEDVVRLIASMADFEPHLRHQADSLDLVEDLILAGMGVGLLPADRPSPPGITLLPISGPDVRLRAYARSRRGRSSWAPLALVLRHLGNTAT